MKTIVFAVAGYNLAETGRMIEIARAAQNQFRVLFASYGGQFEKLIEEEGFPLTKLEPRLTREQLDRLRRELADPAPGGRRFPVPGTRGRGTHQCLPRRGRG